MACQEDYSDEFLQKKMKKWGLIAEVDTPVKPTMATPQQELSFYQSCLEERLIHTIYAKFFSERFLSRSSEKEPFVEKLDLLESTCNQLRQRLQELENRLEGATILSKADLIYEKCRNKIESNSIGKIVAIDVDSEKIAGIGDSIIDAFKDAKKHSKRETFAYRRVGFDYVHKI